MKLIQRYLICALVCCFIFIPHTFAKNNRDRHTIYVYDDEGVSHASLTQTLNTFQSIFRHHYKIQTINAEGVMNGEWSQDAVLFIMPGGADLPYMKKLSGQANRNIKNYVRKGGAYLGLCAGAYYASKSVVFDKSGPLEVIGNRELGFFKGRTIGPVLAKYEYQSESGSRAAHIQLPHPDLEDTDIYYNGGGYFENAKKMRNTKVIGFYENGRPAIIQISYGKGRVILSGVHFEYDPALLDKHNPYSAKIIDTLRASNHARLTLTEFVLKQLRL